MKITGNRKILLNIKAIFEKTHLSLINTYSPMNIDFVKIKNFRKLHSCKIEFSSEETIFVGANNSGKTTAMDALITFLKKKDFKTQDFTITNWSELNRVAKTWVTKETLDETDKSLNLLEPHLPSLDLWINVEESELHYVSHIIPTLDWSGSKLGLRMILEPKDINKLIEDYILHYKKANTLKSTSKTKVKLWPKDFWDFCEQKLNTYFSIKAYILDPSKPHIDQELTEFNIPLEGDPLQGLIKIDIINAQRGFSDANTESTDENTSKKLSNQLRKYYEDHLNPSIDPNEDDIKALDSIEQAKKVFDSNLQKSFAPSIEELSFLNYPGFGNPNIRLSSDIKTTDGLTHDSAVLYEIEKGLSLPEKYNGLGYQNLISIIFRLIRSRDEWMKKGKKLINDDKIIEPLHLVLVEEPEAHLHAQVQQVFIKKAYDVLRNHENLQDNKLFSTQLIISTHSSYIAHQKFECLRYFKRNNDVKKLSTSTVVSLKSVFGEDDLTEKFVVRYLNTTHNDLFFADAIILVEGPAERMLIPHFIRKNHSLLDNCYITILEIGGSHAHRLKPLIEKLGVICLIITDIDSLDPTKTSNKKCQPKLNEGLTTNNDTLKTWLPEETSIDKLLGLKEKDKTKKTLPIYVAYQQGIMHNKLTVYPYTFEDALVLENIEIFKKLEKTSGLLKKMVDATNRPNVIDIAKDAFDAINAKGAKKAEFALDLMYYDGLENLKTPTYIKAGLEWIERCLKSNKENI